MTKRIAGLALMALVMVAVSQPALAGERVQNVDRSGQAAPSAFQRIIESTLPWQATALVRILIGGPVVTPAEQMTPAEVSNDTTVNGVGGCNPRAGVGGCKL
jgi:hypothetical protein